MLKKGLNVILSVVGFLSAFYAVWKFMIFVSQPNKGKNIVQDDAPSITLALLINISLISSFIVQHSVMATPKFKKFLADIGLDVASRSLYVILTSSVLLYIVHYWQTIPQYLWNLDLNSGLVWYTFVGLHVFLWSIIYTGSLLMDITELLGIKQAYYHLRDLPDPMSYKSMELQQLYSHIRHPSFSAFTLILWTFPVMSLDRFLLAVIVTLYMYIAWNTDRRDYYYQQNQYYIKNRELSHVR